MAFRQPACKLQLIVKDKKQHKATVSELNPFKGCQLDSSSSPGKWNLHTYSKSEIVENVLKAENDSRLVFYEDPSNFFLAPVNSQQLPTANNSNGSPFHRSHSVQKGKNYLVRTVSKGQLESQLQDSPKNSLSPDTKPEITIRLLGRKAEHAMTIQRPATAHDLRNRMGTPIQGRTQTAARRRRPSSRDYELLGGREGSGSPQKKSPTRSVLSARKSSQKRMTFNPSKNFEEIYKQKLKNFLDFLFKVNFANGLYVDLQLLPVEAPVQRYRVFVGRGNNNILVKELLGRRFWYEVVTTAGSNCHFYWTQNELKNVTALQPILRKPQEQGSETKEGQSQTLKRVFEFRKELGASRTRLNCKFMSQKQAQQVEAMVKEEGYPVFQAPSAFTAITNRIPGTSCLTIKREFFRLIKTYFEDVIDEDPFSITPRTFLLTELKGYDVEFFSHVATTNPKKLWILKPGQNSSQCKGIEILLAPKVLPRIKERWQQENEKCSFIVQSYIEEPLLLDGDRKFDIRHFLLLTCINGRLKGYWYREGYVRTSAKSFPLVTKIKCRNPQAKKFKNQLYEQTTKWLKQTDVHFTAHSVQQHSDQYGKYEPGNKLTYSDLQHYLDHRHAEYPLYERVVARMREIAGHVLRAAKGRIDPERRGCNFEIIALDYILDEDYNVWLLKCKKNPSLETSSPVLDRIITGLLQQTFRFCLDPLLAPKNHFAAREKHSLPTDYLAALKFELFYEQ